MQVKIIKLKRDSLLKSDSKRSEGSNPPSPGSLSSMSSIKISDNSDEEIELVCPPAPKLRPLPMSSMKPTEDI